MRANTLLHKKLLFAHLALLGATIIWAAAGPIIRYTITYIPPTTFLFLRFLIVGIVLLPYTALELKKEKVFKQDLYKFFLLGLFSQTSILVAFWALKFTSALDFTIISVLGAIMCVWAGHYFFKEKVDKKIEIGLMLASLGTLFIVIEPLFSNGHNLLAVEKRIFGNFLAVLYNLTWVMYVVWSKMCMGEKSPNLKKTLHFLHIKPMKTSYSPTLLVSLSFYVGLLTLIPFFLLESAGFFGEYNFHLFLIEPAGVLGLLYMAIISSIAGYMLYQWGLEHAHITDSAIYGYLGPVFTLPFAYILLSEVPNQYMLYGSAFIALGVIIAERHKS